MATGKHYGAFAKGFMDSILAVYKLKMTKDLYDARAAYYKQRGDAAETNANARANKGAGLSGAMNDAGAGWGQNSGGNAPRGIRNNNPGNIEDGAFAKSQPGYMGSDGRFAKFDSVANGTGALDGLLTKNYSGLTVSQLINKYAPPGENNSSAYAATVAKRLGIDVNAVPDLTNQGVRDTLKQSIVSVEQGIPFERVPTYLAGNTGQNPALVDASGTVIATGGADATALHPAFANRVEALSAEAEKATGQKLSFNELHRTTEQQAEIRTKHEAMPGGVEAHPAAKPGTSYHEFGAAGDMDDNKASRWAKTPGPDGQTPIQRAGLEQLGGQTGKNDPNHIQLPKADWGKTASADDGTYKVAGDAGPVSPEAAARQKADLDAHRAQPDARPPTADPASVGAGSPDTGTPPPGSAIPRGLPSDRGPGPDAAPVPAHPVLGPPSRVDDGSRPDLVPRSGPMGPEQPGAGAIPAGPRDWSEEDQPALPPVPQPGPVMGPARRADDGSRPDLTARGTQMGPEGVANPPPSTAQNVPLNKTPLPPPRPTDTANIPAKNAQPVSSPALPSNPAGNQDPRFTQVDAPNANPVGRGSDRQTTALDLSHMWGPNPPLSSPAATPAPAAAPRPPTPGPDADWSAAAGDEGFAKGGAIPARPTLKLATGGMAVLNAPGYVGPTLQGGWQGTPQSQLAPNQQAWATTTQGLLGQELAGAHQDAAFESANPGKQGPVDTTQYWNQITAMPDAIWPTAAPAAPTPLNEPAPAATNTVAPSAASTITDPTTGTTTGAPGLPNSIQAKSYDPNVDQQTGAGFANTNNTGGTDYSVGTDDLLQQNAAGQISGTNQNNTTILSRRGGPIPKVTRRVNRYDDGGGVSPSAAGMPPGLGGGGQQAIPPIYFNPATYAGAGAPVGKGITQNSATTFNAGAIPSLPMARGGVVGYDDGGMVGMGDPDLQQFANEDMQMDREDAAQPAAYTPPTDATQPGFYIDPTQNISSQVGGEATPAPTSGNAGASASGRASTPPPDPTTAEIHDGQGNPSKGLISAIGDGLHWLGAHLGLTPAGQQQPAVAANPQQQDQRQQFIQHSPDGATYMSAKDAAELDKINDPDGNLSNAYRNIARLEGGYKWALQNGDSAMAGRMAASILHYSVMTSQQLSAQAQKALYDGDLQKTVQYINEASDAVPDGRLVHATLSPDGKSVTFQNKDLDGRVIWQQTGAAHEVLERATAMGKDGKLQWNALESQAAKYDSTFADMQKARQGNAVAGAKEDAANAEAEREATVFSKMHPSAAPAATPTTPALPGPGNSGTTITASNTPLGPEGGGAPAPAPTSATAGATPSPNSAGAAQPNAAPQTADENQGQGPTVANANKGAGLPPPPTSPADIPSPDAQNTDLERPEVEQANRVSIRNGIVSNFKPTSPEPEVMARPDTVPEYAGLTPQGKVAAQKAYQESFAAHKAWEADQNNALRGQIASADKDYTDGLNSRRQAAAMAHSDTAREQTQTHADEAAATRAKAQQDFETKKEQSTREWEVTKPRDPRDVEKTFIDPTTNTSKAPEYMANALGLVKPDGTADVQSLNAKLDRSQQAIMGKAIASAYHFSPDSSPEEISDLVTGIVTNPKYMATPEQLSPDQTYGIPRALIRVDRGDGTSGSMAIPEEDLRNLKALAKTYGAAHPTPPPPKSGVPAAPGVNNYPAPTAPVRMTPRGPVAAPPPAFVPHPAIPRGPSGGTGYGGPRPGMLPPQQLPNG